MRMRWLGRHLFWCSKGPSLGLAALGTQLLCFIGCCWACWRSACGRSRFSDMSNWNGPILLAVCCSGQHMIVKDVGYEKGTHSQQILHLNYSPPWG